MNQQKLIVTMIVILLFTITGCAQKVQMVDAPKPTVTVIQSEPSKNDHINNNPLSNSPDGKYAISANIDEEKGIYKVLLFKDSFDKPKKIFEIIGRDFTFLWSPDSKQVCVNYSGRIWGDFCVIEVEREVLAEPPLVIDILKMFKSLGENITYELNENRPDPYLTPMEWSPEGQRLLVFYQWYDKECRAQNGAYIYDVTERKVTKVFQNPPAEGEPIQMKKPEGFKW